MTVTTHRATSGHKGRWAASIAGIALLATIGFSAQPANAAVAHHLGVHTVCANSLNAYSAASWVLMETLTWGNHVDIKAIYSNGWMLAYTARSGYVYIVNGYYC